MTVFHKIYNNTFWLSVERCLFWEEEKTLILSDTHFGKTGHFRKPGIPVPQNIFKEDLQRLFNLIQFYQPKKIIVVGDLLHSTANKELDLFIRWRKDIVSEIILVKGNHDIVKPAWYQNADIIVHNKKYQIDNFLFVHDQQTVNKEQSNTQYILSGHIHPGISLRGLAKQSLRFPCFFFCDQVAILPAFSHFTGLTLMQPCKSDNIYAIIPSTAKGEKTSLIKL